MLTDLTDLSSCAAIGERLLRLWFEELDSLDQCPDVCTLNYMIDDLARMTAVHKSLLHMTALANKLSTPAPPVPTTPIGPMSPIIPIIPRTPSIPISPAPPETPAAIRFTIHDPRFTHASWQSWHTTQSPRRLGDFPSLILTDGFTAVGHARSHLPHSRHFGAGAFTIQKLK